MLAAFDFASLIAPISPEQFFAEYWESQPLFLQRESHNFYSKLISQSDIEHIISSTDLRHPAIRLAKNGSYLPPHLYTTNFHYGDDVFAGIPNIGRVFAEYQSGATVALPALHQTWEPLQLLHEDLESHFDHVVHMNAYLTPGNAAGFSAHYDAHEVFILQIAGKKHWQVYEPPFLLPHESQPFTPEGYIPSEPLYDMDLTPGDLLYLPRGYVHAARTSEVHSIHITLGISVYTWVELVLEIASATKHLATFRKGLPPGFASRDDVKSIVKAKLRELAAELGGTSDFDAIVESFTDRIKAGKVRKRESFRADEVVIDLDVVLRAPEKSRYQVSHENGSIKLEFDGKKLLLPHYVQGALDVMCSQASFSGRDFPPDLDDEAKLVLLRYLQLERFIERAG